LALRGEGGSGNRGRTVRAAVTRAEQNLQLASRIALCRVAFAAFASTTAASTFDVAISLGLSAAWTETT
jgi:hypothetical protein